MRPEVFTLRSKGAKWHLLGFFELSLYWHPQTVLQRTHLEGSFERTLLRTLMWDSLKEPWRVLLNHKLGAEKNHLGFFKNHVVFMKGSLKDPMGFILRPCFWHWGWFKLFYCELHNLILDIYDHRTILLSSWRMLQPFPGLVILYRYVIIVLTIEAYMIIRLGVRIRKCTLFVVARQVPQYYSIVASCKN